jgi:hypothetical protein
MLPSIKLEIIIKEYLNKIINLTIKAQISAKRLIAGGAPNLAIIAISQKNLIIGCNLNSPMLINKFRELVIK